MNPRYRSMLFVRNDAGIGIRRLRSMKRVARAVVCSIEERLELPKRAIIDWTIRSERPDGYSLRLVVGVEWYLPTRPRNAVGRSQPFLFVVCYDRPLRRYFLGDACMTTGQATANEITDAAVDMLSGNGLEVAL